MNKIKIFLKLICDNITITLWILISAVLIAFTIDGYLRDVLSANIFLSYFPTAVLANISIIFAYKTDPSGFRIAKKGWCLLCVLVILFTLITVDPATSESYLEAGIFIIYPMMVFSFPSSFIWLYVFGGLAYASYYFKILSPIHSVTLNFYLINFILWIGFFISGYLQWFKLIPLIIEKWRKRKYSREQA